jgi:hypothetical protein
MDLDEIEEIYRKELEQAENDFLKEVANSKDSSPAEKRYKEKVKIAQNKYYVSVNSYLEKEKKNYGKKEQKKKPEITAPFQVLPGNFELSRWEKRKLKWGLFF